MRNKALAVASALVGVGLVGAVDHLTGPEVGVFPLYFLPVGLAAWGHSRRAGYTVGSLAAGVWAYVNYLLVPGGWPDDAVLVVNVLSHSVGNGVVAHLVGLLKERLAQEERLSRNDPLTQLANRRAFFERAEGVIAGARRKNVPLALAYLSVDGFAEFVGEFGEGKGDAALLDVSSVLQRNTRLSDVIGRVGDDEFAVLLFDIDVATANLTLERIRAGVAEVMKEKSVPLTATIGAACFKRPPSSLDGAVRATDELMEKVKAAGRDRLQLEVVDPEPTGEGPAARSVIPPLEQ